MTRIATLLARRQPVVHLLAPEQTVSEAVRVMNEHRVGAVLVSRNDRLVGIFSERDVIRRVLAKGLDPGDVELEGVMTREPVTAEPSESVGEAIAKMAQVKCRHLPILSGGQVGDTLSMRDLLITRLGEREHEIEELQRYIRGDRPS